MPHPEVRPQGVNHAAVLRPANVLQLVDQIHRSPSLPLLTRAAARVCLKSRWKQLADAVSSLTLLRGGSAAKERSHKKESGFLPCASANANSGRRPAFRAFTGAGSG